MFTQQFTKGAGRAEPESDALLDALVKPNRAGPRRLQARRSTRSPRPASSARCSRSFRRASRATPASLDYLQWLLHAFAGYSLAVELRHSSWSDAFGDTLSLLNAHGAALVQIDEPKFRFSIAQNQLPNIPGSTTCACTAGTPRSGGSTRRPRIATTTSTRPSEVTEFVETIAAAREIVKKVVSVHEQPLLREVGRERGDDQEATRRADRRASIRKSFSHAIRRSRA